MALSTTVQELVQRNEKNLLAKKDEWSRISVSEVAKILNGFAFKSSLFTKYKSKGMPLIRIRDVKKGKTETYYKGDYPKEYLVKKGDILIGMDGDFDIAFWKGEDALLNQRVCKIIVNEDKFNKKFLYYLMPGYLQAIHNATSAVTVKHLSSRDIAKIPLPNPSLELQQQIVDEIEKQFTRLEASVKDLKSVKDKLEIYRKSVLKSAFDIDCDFEKLGKLMKTTSGGTPYRGNKSFYEGHIPWLKSGELEDNLNIIDSKEHITEEAIQKSSAKIFPAETVLIAMYGATTGKLGIIRNECSTNQAVCGILPSSEYIPEFIFYYLLSKRWDLINQGKGGAQPNISQGIIKSTLFPQINKDRQEQIINEIESHFSVIDKLQEVIESSLNKAEKLRKSILKSAFEGKLVKNNNLEAKPTGQVC